MFPRCAKRAFDFFTFTAENENVIYKRAYSYVLWAQEKRPPVLSGLVEIQNLSPREKFCIGRQTSA
jgi:hypothetical protein